mgnify:CR=1 FL=1
MLTSTMFKILIIIILLCTLIFEGITLSANANADSNPLYISELKEPPTQCEDRVRLIPNKAIPNKAALTHPVFRGPVNTID